MPKMHVHKTGLKGLFLIEPQIFYDRRGFFFESYNRETYSRHGIEIEFVQDNHSYSSQGVLRGLHYQVNEKMQAKLVRVTRGEVFDVAVDIRPGSPTFGQWEGFYLSESNMLQLFIPVGFAHGFCVMSDTVEFLYKCSSGYSPSDERGIIWNDPDIGIQWPVQGPILSKKDSFYPRLRDMFDIETLRNKS